MFQTIRENKKLLLSYIIVGVILMLPTMISYFVSLDNLIVPILKYSVLALFSFNVYLSLFRQHMPIYHPYLIFLGIIGLFVLSRIVMDVLGGPCFAQTTQFSDYVFDIYVQKRLLLNVYLALYGLQIGALLCKTDSVKRYNYLEGDIDWQRIGLFFFYVGLPFLVYQYINFGFEVINKGYGARLSGVLEYENTFLVTIMSRFALSGFFFYIASTPQNRWFYFHLILFLIVFYLQLMGGARSYTMCFSLVLFSLYYLTRRSNFKWIIVAVVVSLLFLVSVGVGVGRSTDKVIKKEVAEEFINQQGFALQILGYAIEYKDDIDYHFQDMFAHATYRYDLMKERLTGELAPRGKVNIMETYNTLSFQLTHRVNPDALKGGWDMASSYLAEFFLLGREWVILFGNILVGFITVFATEKCRKSKYGILFLLYFLPCWIFIPRDNIFDFITDNMSNVCFVVGIFIFMTLYKCFNCSVLGYSFRKIKY